MAANMETRIRNPELQFLKLPTYSGDIYKWDRFWNVFSAMIDSRSDFNNVTKFLYLNQCLTGKAKDLIQNIQITNDNYPKAKEQLKGWFCNPDLVRSYNERALQEMQFHTSDTNSMEPKLIQMEGHCDALYAHGYDDNNTILPMWIVPNFPTDAAEFVCREALDGGYTVDTVSIGFLRKTMRKYIEIQRRMESVNARHQRSSGSVRRK